MTSRKKLGPRGGAHRTHKEPVKADPIPLKGINVWGSKVGISGARQISPALVITQEHKHVGLRANGRANNQKRTQEDEERAIHEDPEWWRGDGRP